MYYNIPQQNAIYGGHTFPAISDMNLDSLKHCDLEDSLNWQALDGW